MYFTQIAVILGMIDFNYRPTSYFDGTGPTSLIAKLSYPESQWGEALSLYATPIDGEIHFEMVDFYGNDYSLHPATSRPPLSLEEISVLIEALGVPEEGMQRRANPSLAGIPEAESWVYPQLKDCLQQKRKACGRS